VKTVNPVSCYVWYRIYCREQTIKDWVCPVRCVLLDCFYRDIFYSHANKPKLRHNILVPSNSTTHSRRVGESQLFKVVEASFSAWLCAGQGFTYRLPREAKYPAAANIFSKVFLNCFA